eukprot:TRINITY_DN17609_c0_g1_i1.p1 TRINITY_DN17609_c0_g1~~TRINITY_DN17609_c0_g1_i1.p1  ORF type:complete len:340 (-),score=91.15 TRINITY_DN17609_c0_g1_i1:37-1020(-)
MEEDGDDFEHFMSYEQAEEILRGFVSQDLQIREAFRMRGGIQHRVFLVKTKSEVDQEQKFVFKMYRNPEKMQNELMFYNLIIEKDPSFPIAKILFRSEEEPFIIMELLGDGCMFEADRMYGRHGGNSLYHQAGQILKRLHSFPVGDRFGIPNAEPSFFDGAAFMQHLFETWIAKFENAHPDHKDMVPTIRTYLKDHSHLLTPSQSRPVFCHNDFHKGNILISLRERGLRIVGIIDFEQVLFADADWDIAKFLFYGIRDDVDGKTDFFDGYFGSDHELPQEYWDKYKLFRLMLLIEQWNALNSDDHPQRILDRIQDQIRNFQNFSIKI